MIARRSSGCRLKADSFRSRPRKFIVSLEIFELTFN
jgi:hypothetical protein